MIVIDRFISAFRVLMGWGDPTALEISYNTRETVWALNLAMYDGIVYERGGPHLAGILQNYCGVKDSRGRMIPHFMPIREIVEGQQNVLRGTWGKEIKPVKPDAGDGDKEQPVDAELAEALKTVWRDSNLDSEKARIIRMAAVYGTVGLRVSRIPGTDRVVIQPDDPRRIRHVEEDSSGNVVAVSLRYHAPKNFGTVADPDVQNVEVIELITKTEFSKTVQGIQQVTDDDRTNTLGFCPYVLLRHKDNGSTYGDWSFKGLEPQVHDINWRISQQGRSINRHQFPKWFLTAGGPEPKVIDTDGETSTWYVQAQPGTPPPDARAIVPQIDHAASLGYTNDLRDVMRRFAPILAVTDLSLLSGLSGETIAQVLKPAEAAILGVRPNYHHAFIRTMQMAVSIRNELGLSSVGGKVGPGSGDAAYESGALAFAFADMPALPPTVYQNIQQATLDALKSGAAKPSVQTIDGNPTPDTTTPNTTSPSPRIARVLATAH